MSGEKSNAPQDQPLTAVTYPDGIKILTDPALVREQSARFGSVRKDVAGQPVEWRHGQEPSGNELWDLGRAMIGLPRERRMEPVEQGRRINLARRMARMSLGTESSAAAGKKKPRNDGVSTQAAHEIGIARAPAEAFKKYSNQYGVSVEWLVTGDYIGYQGNIAQSSVFIRLSLGHKDGFFLKGCFPDRRRWNLNRAFYANDGYRLVSPDWLDPWLVCAIFLGVMHKSDDDLDYKNASTLKDISENIKKLGDEIRYLRPRYEVEVAPDAE